MAAGSRPRAARQTGGRGDTVPHRMPLTVSRLPLLQQGNDEQFRNLINGLLTISVRMELIRNHLAGRLGVSGPQYSLMMAIGQQQKNNGISVGTLARSLHVSSAFIASESNKLARLGLVEKRQNVKDKRSVLLQLSPRALTDLDKLGPTIRAVNDSVFATLDKTDFNRLSDIVERVVKGSALALHGITAPDDDKRPTFDKHAPA